jgi:CRISPR/Cas system-associated endonuclease Cas1
VASLAHLPEATDAVGAFEAARAALGAGGSIEEARPAESQAAAAYWSAWSDVAVRFARSEAAKVPEHWLRFGARSSLLTGGPRLAVNPANALLNYLYALAEVESRLVLLAVGLDPGLGIVHRDQANRDSLALDLMEAIRPEVDSFGQEARRRLASLIEGNRTLTGALSAPVQLYLLF